MKIEFWQRGLFFVEAATALITSLVTEPTLEQKSTTLVPIPARAQVVPEPVHAVTFEKRVKQDMQHPIELRADRF